MSGRSKGPFQRLAVKTKDKQEQPSSSNRLRSPARLPGNDEKRRPTERGRETRHRGHREMGDNKRDRVSVSTKSLRDRETCSKTDGSRPRNPEKPRRTSATGSPARLPGNDEKRRPTERVRETSHRGHRERGDNKRDRVSVSTKSLRDKETCGKTDGSRPRNPEKPRRTSATGSIKSLPNTKEKSSMQLSRKRKHEEQGLAVEGSRRANKVAKSSPDKGTCWGKGAGVNTSTKHPTVPSHVQGNQQQKEKRNSCRSAQGRAAKKPRLEEKAKGSLASNHRNRTRQKSEEKHSPALSYNAVKQLINKEPPEIVNRLNQSITSLQKLLRSKDVLHTCEDFTCCIIHVLAKACEAPSSEQLNNILAALKDSVFLREGVGRCLEGAQSSSEMSEKVDRRLFENLIRLLWTYLRHLPSSFVDVPIDQMQRVLQQLKFEGKEDVLVELSKLKDERNNAIKEHRESMKPHKGRTASHGQPPNDFRDIPVCPSVNEVVTGEKPFLRKHVAKGRYHDVEHYLDVQFRLLREDFLSPLREGIAEVVQRVPRQQCQQRIKLYNKVRILGKDYTRKGIVYKVQFDASPFTKTRWNSSKRLIFGSFLCLSKDNFQTMIFATVANRDARELMKGHFDIQFIEDQDVYGIQEGNEMYVMAESSAYFESYRHVLSGLKEMDEDNLPFKKYLVECNPDVDPPRYLRHEDGEAPVSYHLSKTLHLPRRGKVTVLQSEDWPSTSDVSLNESQLEAFKTALTREFSVIQGPPGTGKTFVGAKIVECLLDNRRAWDPEHIYPMLMVCYTNHALDQFLEKVLEFLKVGIIRVGGRSKSQQLERFNLKLFVRGHCSPECRDIENEMTRSSREIKDNENALRSFESAILSFEYLEELMDDRHADQFYRGIEGITIAKEVFKFWICHKEANTPWDACENATSVNGIAQDMIKEYKEAGKTDDDYESAEDADWEKEEEEEEFVDEMDYPLPIQTNSAANRTSENPTSNSTTEHQRMRKSNAEEMTLKPLHTYVSPAADGLTDTTTYHQDLSTEEHLMGDVYKSREALNYEDYKHAPDVSSCERKSFTSIHGQVLCTSNHQKDLELSGDIVGEKTNMFQEENDIEDADPWHSTDPIVGELEGETIEIEHEANLLQGRRYLAGEEDDFLPLRAVSKGEDEGDDCRSSDDAGRECYVSRSSYYYAGIDNSNNSLASGCSDSRERTEDHLQTIMTSNYDNRNVIGNYEGHDVDDEDDIGWEEVVPKKTLQRGVTVDPNTSRNHRRQSGRYAWHKNLPEANFRMRGERMMSEKEAGEVKDIWMLSTKDRYRLYLYWRNCYRELCIVNIRGEELVYERHCRTLEEIRGDKEEEALRKATVIGMTTSGAARYHDILQRIQPRIVVIEEAAEVLEAHIITSLTRDTQHVIMIGDHKQLRPKTTVFELAQKYNLQISLFERMVLNKMDCKRLSTQHRMRPEIAQLTKRIYNHEIIDHNSVCHFDDVRGFQENLFFLDHQYPETFVSGLQSYSNKHEANLAVAICRYLLLHGYKREQITVLTMYTGQLLEFKQLMPRKEFEGIRTSVVDNFQGEENDIIVLSLVRSSGKEGKIGFLKESNRICVALSRARQGFYCIGNFALLSTHCELWKDICDDMRTKNTMADALKLVCRKHHKIEEVRTSKDFDKFPEGGCGEHCDDRQDCGHVCGRLCDPRDPSPHTKYRCQKPCLMKCEMDHPCNKVCHHPKECDKCIYRVIKLMPECGHELETQCGTDVSKIICQQACEKFLACGHSYQSKCGLPWERRKCRVKVMRTLDCRHEHILPCHKDPSTVDCHAPCQKVLPCGHHCPLRCFNECLSAKCENPVEAPLSCGHHKTVECQYRDIPGNCVEKCEKQLSCGHGCPGACIDDCTRLKCEVKIDANLNCGHRQTVHCGDYPDSVTCQSMCGKPCSRDHPCRQRCHAGSECKECKEVITFEIPGCGHRRNVQCYVDTASFICQRRCTRERTCGHKCQDKCGNPCDAKPCKVTVCRTLPCNHEVALACHVDPNEYACDVVVDKDLPCEHGTREKCHVQLHDIVCKAVVTKALPCGHKMRVMCHVEASAVQCDTSVKTELPCRHLKDVACSLVSTGLQGVSCEVMVRKILLCLHTKQVQCSADVDREFCSATCDKSLVCIHACPGRCSDDCANFRCQQEISKILPCGHHVTTKCCEDVRNICCQRKCERFLKCSHPCPGKCSEKCDHQLCQERVVKRLRCQYEHRYTFRCYMDVTLLTCLAKIKKKFPCGHSKMLSCHIATNAICKLRCTRKQPCKHRCQGFCGEPCSKYPCRGSTNKRLPCNHIVQVGCRAPPEDVKCPEPCGGKLDCGHTCTGQCFECRIRGYHEVCQLLCGRKLVCSHRCQAPCNIPCPPCNRYCERRCTHGKCRGRCSVDCEPCCRPCAWRCLHYQCKNLCKEMCDRPACDAPCPELLPCRHPCIGLCGENCPTLCRICHASKLSAFCHESAKNQRVRFVQLIDCGHVIEVQRMDEWMKRPLDIHVQPRQCPLCSTPIRWSFRYGNNIKRSFEDVCNVVKEAQEAANEVKENVKTLDEEIDNEFGNVPLLDYFPDDVRRFVEHRYYWESQAPDSIESCSLAHLYSVKNHLEIIRVIWTTLQAIRSTHATYSHANETLSPSEQSEVEHIVEGTKRALQDIEWSLREPQMDLRIISQLHNSVVKFALAMQLIDAWCNLARGGLLLTRITEAKLQEQTRRLVFFVRGQPSAIDLPELLNTVNSVREELRDAALPKPQSVIFMNFPGFARYSWFKCENGHVYGSRKIICDGRVIEEQECRRCADNSSVTVEVREDEWDV